MSTALIVARFALFAVFAVAALAKLADLPGSRRALEGFGVPPRFVSAGAVGLPAFELLAAGLMAFASTAQVGAALGAALLAAFVAAIGRAIKEGRAPDCHCFGQLHSKPAGGETVGRNAVLLCIALFVAVAGPGPSLTTWISDHDITEVALAATALVAAFFAFACYALWRENRDLKAVPPDTGASLPSMVIGQPTPDFSLLDLAGATVSSRAVFGGQRTVMVFVSSHCGPCVALLPELARWKERLAGRLGIHVVAAGDEAELRRLAAEHRIEMLLDLDGETSRAWGVPATPSGIEIDGDGVVATLPASGGPAIEGLIRVALKRPSGGVALRLQQVQRADATPAAD